MQVREKLHNENYFFLCFVAVAFREILCTAINKLKLFILQLCFDSPSFLGLGEAKKSPAKK